MITRARKKSTKQRASRTHGWGAGKKHRGAGHRGGRGRAGIGGKRGAQRKTQVFAGYEPTIGKNSDTIVRRRVKIKALNLSELDKFVSQSNNGVLDLTALGYDKLLGTGTATKIKIRVKQISARAKQKLEKVGGSLV